MLILRLTQYTAGPGQYRVVVNLREDNQPEEEAIVHFPFALTEQEQEELRWYLEDYLQDPHDPNPTIAARVEQRLAQLGDQLFEAIFQQGEASDLWAVLRRNLNNTRVEIALEDVRQATAICCATRAPKCPWPCAPRRLCVNTRSPRKPRNCPA